MSPRTSPISLVRHAVLAVERSEGLGLVDDHLLAGDVRAEGGGHVARGHQRLGAGPARVAVVQRADAEAVRLALGAEHLGRAHAMGVDDLVLRRVQGRVGDEAGPAGENSGHQHAERVVGHGLADALAAVVENLHESQAGIGRQLARGESAQAVHGHRVGAVLLEQLERGQVDAAGLVDRLRRGPARLDVVARRECLGRLRPARGPLGRFVAIDLLVERLQFVEVDVTPFRPEEVLLLTRRDRGRRSGTATGGTARRTRRCRSERNRVVRALQLAVGRERRAVGRFTLPGEARPAWCRACEPWQTAGPRRPGRRAAWLNGGRRDLATAEVAVAGQETRRSRRETRRPPTVGFPRLAIVADRAAQRPRERGRVDEVAVDLVLQRRGLANVVGRLDHDRDELDRRASFAQRGQDLALAALHVKAGIGPRLSVLCQKDSSDANLAGRRARPPAP